MAKAKLTDLDQEANQRKDVLVRMRVTRSQRAAFARAATRAGLDLSAWLRTVALAAVIQGERS